MNYKSIILFALPFVSINTFAQSAKKIANQSEWVSLLPNGKLQYKNTASGDKIMDFSYAGYMGGGISLPQVPAKRTLQPSGNDDTKMIQDAIDEVAQLPLVNGFRGAVVLGKGKFTCSSGIHISASGIVLRGSGSGKDGSTLFMTGNKHTAIIIENTEKQSNTANVKPLSTDITDKYVAAGAHTFTVASSAGFKTGDRVIVTKPATTSWIHFMQMDSMKRDGKQQRWIANNANLSMERTITNISHNTITIDAPYADNFDTLYGGIATVTLALPSTKAERIGIEQLHIQCAPLAVSYTEAPYAAVRIAGNNCWVKDVYCEETMNTIVFAGNHNTVQDVHVTHTYPNLGASKPADFSLDGSLNLIDRCSSMGDNTYFVWTSSLKSGPNVLLNSTFRGHGSRIQPHERWSTGLLVDNCTIPDGNIDFMNRGVAGSGHGWTMGWAVAWNCIAQNYIIQNPPGTLNWAIGCIGGRQQTAKLFDSAPILPDGAFDSHGSPVLPQSLYLAQLAARSGKQAIENIGYNANDLSQFKNKNIAPLPPLVREKDGTLGENLAWHHPVNASNTRGTSREFSGENAVDTDHATYWVTTDNAAQANLIIDTENPQDINAITLSEPAGIQHIRAYKIEGQVNSDWKVLAEGTTVGDKITHRFPTATVWKVRITILQSDGYAAINNVGFYLAKK